MSPQWRLLAPIEAADGMLMFAFSTAIVVAVIQRLIQPRLDRITHAAVGKPRPKVMI